MPKAQVRDGGREGFSEHLVEWLASLVLSNHGINTESSTPVCPID